MPSGHFMFIEEAAWGTFLTPTKAVPVIRSGIGAGAVQNLLDNPSTGMAGRAQQPQRPSTFAPGGTVEMLWYPQQIGYILRTVLPTRAKVAAGTGWLNKLLPNDDATVPGSLSVQEKYATAMAINSRGCKLNQMTLRLAVGEYARWTFEFLAQDSTAAGAAWLDATVSPAVVASPPYSATIVDPFTFWEAEMRLGGTVALTTGELVVTGGTAREDFDTIEVNWNFNLDGEAYGVNLGKRYRQSLPDGVRNIGISFSPNFDLVGSAGLEFWNLWRAGTPAVIQLNLQHQIEFVAGQKYFSKIVFPQVKYSSGSIPELNRTYGLRRVDINAVAEQEQTVDYDWGMTINSTEDLTI